MFVLQSAQPLRHYMGLSTTKGAVDTICWGIWSNLASGHTELAFTNTRELGDGSPLKLYSLQLKNLDSFLCPGANR